MKANRYIKCFLSRQKAHSPKPKDYLQFEATSIGDMAFLLLIFFIVTGSFVVRQGIFFNLPSKTAGAVKVEESNIADVFPSNEGFYYDGNLISREKLKDSLSTRVKNNPKTIVVINMEKEVRYERLVDAVSAAKESGVKELSLKDFAEEK